MSNGQIRDELQSYLALLNKMQIDVMSAHEKFQIALASTLKLLEGESSTLAHLQGNPDDLKGYLIQFNTNLIETNKSAFQRLIKNIERLIECISSLDIQQQK